MESVSVNCRAGWLALLSILGCTPLPRQTAKRSGDAEALALLRAQLGAQAERMGSFPSYMHVVDGFVVLYRRPPESWAIGEPDTMERSIDKERASTAFRRVRMDQLPPILQRLPGTRLQLFNAQGGVCEARITELLILGQAFTANYGFFNRGDPDYHLPKAREELAQAIWADSNDHDELGRSLGARITPLSGACDKASFARVASGQKPRIYPARDASPEWQRAAQVQFRMLLEDPVWCANLKAKTPSDLENSCQHLLTQNHAYWQPKVKFFPSIPEFGSLITASIAYGDSQCVPWDYRICEVWAVSGPPERARFRHLDGVTCSRDGEPEAAIAFHDNRKLSFLVPEGLHVPEATQDVSLPLQSDYMFLPKSFVGDGCAPPSSSPAHL